MWFFRALAVSWALLAVPGVILWPRSVLFVILMSIYANAASSWASAEAADDRAITDRLDRIEAQLDAILEHRPVHPCPVPFSLDWLSGASAHTPPITVCANGHMVVRGRAHFQPVKFSADLRALHCVPVDHQEGGDQ